MDAQATKAGLFSFLTRQPPAGTGGWEIGAKMLRYAGIIILVGGALSVLTTAWVWVSLQAYPLLGAIYAAAAVMGLVFGLAILAAGIWWINFAYTHWCNRDVRGYKHGLIIAILLVVFGGISLFNLMGVSATMAAYEGAGTLAMAFLVQSLVGGLVAVGYLATGIMVLVNRNKADCKAAFGQGAPTSGYTPHS